MIYTVLKLDEKLKTFMKSASGKSRKQQINGTWHHFLLLKKCKGEKEEDISKSTTSTQQIYHIKRTGIQQLNCSDTQTQHCTRDGQSQEGTQMDQQRRDLQLVISLPYL